MTRARPGPSLDDRVADQRLMVLDDRRDVAEREPLPGPRAILHDRDTGEIIRGRDRQDVLDAEPLVRRVDESAGSRRRGIEERQRRDPQGVAGGLDHVAQRDAVAARIRSGSTWTWSWRSRWPQIATLATPGTLSSRGRIVQRASTDMSMSETSFDDRPTIMTRLDDESGWSIAGDFDTFGRACAWVSRSATIWRARSTSVPGSKYRTIDERPGDGLRVDLVEEGDAVEQVGFERDRDQLLDFIGRQAERLRLDLDIGRPELGQRVEGRA